jgi:hypothetical protein
MESIIQIGVDIILFVCLLYLMFFKEYIKKKGGNLADKQDIADITKHIELVKKEFTQENEILKANLQFVINNQLQQSNEERNAIINFFDYFGKWINVGLLNTKVNEYNRNNIDDLIQKDRDLNDFYTQTNVAQNRISLLVEDEKIVKLSHELISETLRFNQWTQKILLELRLNLEGERRGFEMFLELIKIKPMPVEALKIAKEEKEFHAKRKEICDEYYKNNIEEYKKVIRFSTKFTETVKMYLNKLREVQMK